MSPMRLIIKVELGSVPALDPRNIGTRLEPHKNSISSLLELLFSRREQ
jgi:hypothetical protein